MLATVIEEVAGIQRAVAEELKGASVQLVCSRGCHHADLCAGPLPVLGPVAVLQDVEFPNCIHSRQQPTGPTRQSAVVLRWSYWKARRYFSHVDGICVCCRPKRYKQHYRMVTIPLSMFAREWQKMTGQQPEFTEMIRERLLALVTRK